MTRFLRVIALVVCLVAVASAAVPPSTYRVEGQALGGEPSWPAAAGVLTITSTDPADNGKHVLVRGLSQSREWQEERIEVGGAASSLSFLRVNREYWQGAADEGPVGTVSISHPTAGVMATIEPGAPSGFHAFFSVGPGRASVVARSTTGNVSRVMHRRGQAPQSAAEVSVDGQTAPGVGDFWIEGSGEVSLDLEQAR